MATTVAEARVFLGPGGRNNTLDEGDAVSFYFPFALSDAISIFTNIVVPGPDPFSVSNESRREVFWPLIKRITNYPKAVDPVLAGGSTEIGDQVEALMASLDNAFHNGKRNVYINCAGTLVGVNGNLIHQFLELSEKVFHLWKNRNEAARPEDFGTDMPPTSNPPGTLPPLSTLSQPSSSSTPSLTPTSTQIPLQTRLSGPEMDKRHSIQPQTAELDSRPIPSRASISKMTDNTHEPRGRELAPAPPSYASDAEAAAARQAEYQLQQQLLAAHAQTLAAQLQSSQEPSSSSTPSRNYPPFSNTPSTSQFSTGMDANTLPISEIWRATIYRIYSQQNESLTKYRRPNWLFHLESHGIRTIGDLGGWREDDESTRQLANNIITKLQETGYGTKGLQSRIKAIVTADIKDAIMNVEKGGIEKFKPGPILGKRVTPIKWSSYNPGSPLVSETNGSMPPPGMDIDGNGSPQQSGLTSINGTPELSAHTGKMENPTLKRVDTSGSGDFPRVKRKRTTSPTHENLTLLIPAEMAHDQEKQRSQTARASTGAAPVAPMMRAESAQQTGFTPINIKSVMQASSASTPTGNINSTPTPKLPTLSSAINNFTTSSISSSATNMATPPIPNTNAFKVLPPIASLPSISSQNMPTPTPSGRQVDVSMTEDIHPRPPTPTSTIDQEEESEPDFDYDASMMDELVHSRLESLKRGLEVVKRDVAETRRGQAAAIQQITRTTIENLQKDIPNGFHHLKDLAKETQKRIERLESLQSAVQAPAPAPAPAPAASNDTDEKIAALEAHFKKSLEGFENRINAKIDAMGAGVTEKFDNFAAQYDGRLERLQALVEGTAARKQVETLEDRIQTLADDTNARIQMLENPVPAQTTPTSSRRSTRNSISQATPPVITAVPTETRLRLDKLESRLVKLEDNGTPSGDDPRLAKLNKLYEIIDDLENAVHFLLSRVWNDKPEIMAAANRRTERLKREKETATTKGGSPGKPGI